MKIYLTFVLTFLISSVVYAGKHTATLVFMKGDVHFLTSPKEKPHKGSGQVLFAKKYYKLKKAKIGRKIKVGEAVKVGPNGRAKLTFSNGDQFIVSPGTTYELGFDDGSTAKKKAGSVLRIFYGKMRGIVSKKGPRNRLKIKTRGAVAGVRGTDFFISADPKKVQFTVLRGRVAIEKAEGIKKPVIVETGMSANVVATKELDEKTVQKKEEVAIAPVVQETTKQDLLEIQEVSRLNVKEMLNEEKVDKAVAKEIKALEEKAKVATIEDIKSEANGDAKKLAR